jgi:stage V sporulation protein G
VEISEIKVFLVDEPKLKAFVSVVFDRCFMVNDIKIIRGREGLFVSMPSRRKKNGEFKDVAHPLNNETRSWMEESILTAYRDTVSRERGRTRPEDEATRPLPALGAIEPIAAGQDGADEALVGDGSLEEVHRRHLTDSFWNVR